ncbi:MAG: glycosyltransferase [Candidatus Pacebacteria bacterium]|nr:glycosyltransferase [Candidatus Paceibacterota bacterium]
MKLCLYSPYIPEHLGGGEKYLLDVALTAQELGYQPVVAVSSKQPLSQSKKDHIRNKYQQFLGKSLAQIEFQASPLGTRANFFKKLVWTKQFERLFYLTDGSLFYSLAGKNILHIQVPLLIDKSGWKQRLKKRNWDQVCTNSAFTKSVVQPNWPIKVDQVLEPMIEVGHLGQGVDLGKKDKLILHVGRFFKQLHSKRQDVLVDNFRRLRKKYPKETKDWRLVLIGNIEDPDYAKEVATSVKSLPVEIIHQVSREELDQWYQRASIYWHATGYRINDQVEPAKVEHFGISTVEAMAAGCAPVVIGKGGQLEVVGQELEKYTWLTKRDCVKNTIKLIRNQGLLEQVQKQAQAQAKEFGPASFKEKLKKMLD